MAENNSIYNLSRQDLLTVLDGFIEHSKQIDQAEYKCHDRYDEIANEILLLKYKELKNLVIAYFLAPFKSYSFLSWLFALQGDYALILLLFFPISFIMDLSRGAGLSSTTEGIIQSFGLLLLSVLLGTIGYFMGRENYKQNWFEKAKKKYKNEIDAAANSDPQFIDYKNKFTSLMNDATYQQYRSSLPQRFQSRTLFNIIEIYQMLLDHRADNFEEAENAWRQEKHDREVREAKQEAERQAELAEREAKRQAELAEREAKREARRQAELAEREAIASTFERERRERREAARDQAIKDIAKELKRLK